VLKNFSIVLHNKPENSISYEYFNDEFDERPSPRKFSNGLIEYTINSARSQLLNKAAISELLKKNEVSLFDKLPAVWMGVPIPISENLTLVFVFKEYFNERYLTEKELELINAVTLPLTRAIERKMIEEENKLTLEKLEESNQTKDNFFSIVSHDLRSPFNSIIGFTEILKQDFDELSKDELKTYLNSIYDTSKQINNLLNNLLQYSKFKLGKFEFIPAAIDLKNTIAKNVDILKGSILKKEIKVREDIAENLNVCADENMINSILLNLLTNAIKFSHRGGIINLKAFNTGKSAQIEIKDFGVGMDELTLNKIFKLDSKKVIPGTENELGTGLGLLLVKEFTEKHGGSIYVESKAGKGSTFSITLPLAKNSK
jgi:signal transduction histidine kinase